MLSFCSVSPWSARRRKQVLNDLSTGYGVAYQPSDDKRDGKWREVRVEIVGRPDVVARTRRGYYAR